MKKKMITLVLAALIVPLLTTAWAQQRAGKQMYSREYDTSTEETIEGEVTEITYNPARRNADQVGVHMMVAGESDTMSVHLGPVWYMDQQDEKIKKGDKVTVTGSRVIFEGSPTLIAASVKRDRMTLRLRDQNGFPFWRGWRMNKGNW